MLRKIINIDESKCDGCGNCIPGCAEGALQIIDGKARLISDLFCDGLGACIGHCPQNAMVIEEREAEPYDERKVMEYIIKGGVNVIKAHMEHLREHEEFIYLKEAILFLEENGIENPLNSQYVEQPLQLQGCPGSRTMSFNDDHNSDEEDSTKRKSHLTQWPIQLHLVSPQAPYYRDSNLLLAADCCGFSYPDFHKDFLNGKSLAIACPKLDTNKEIYIEKLTSMIDDSNVQSITVMIMQVPCCGGLLQMAQKAVESSSRNIPLKVIVLGINGEIIHDEEI